MCVYTYICIIYIHTHIFYILYAYTLYTLVPWTGLEFVYTSGHFPVGSKDFHFMAFGPEDHTV